MVEEVAVLAIQLVKVNMVETMEPKLVEVAVEAAMAADHKMVVKVAT